MTDQDARPAAAKMGWMPADIDLAELTHVFDARELAVLDRLAKDMRARGIAPIDVKRDMFSDPAIDPLLARLRLVLRDGPGLIFLKNLPIDHDDLDQIRTIYCGIGAHFGTLASQSQAGDKLGEVRSKAKPGAGFRAYDRPRAISLHNDSTEILSLLCVEDALDGGDNIFTSSIALYETIRRERPDDIPLFERGFPMWRLDEQSPGREAITPYSVPVFGETDGRRSCVMRIELAEPTAEALGRPLGEREKAAIDNLIKTRERPEFAVTVGLKPGEAVFMNNYEILHARTPYISRGVDRPRFLLRLWLQDASPRKLPDGMLIYDNPSGLQGIDPVPAERAAQEREKNHETSEFMREALRTRGLHG